MLCMKCNRCKEMGAERREIRFQSNATVVTYLCEKCAKAALRNDNEIAELVVSPSK